MVFSSLWVMFLYTVLLTFPFYNGSFMKFTRRRSPPNCARYMEKPHFCTRESDPVCATNGRTYANRCVFCSEKKESGNKFDFYSYGRC